MRSFWIHGLCAVSSLAVALVLLAINSAFEAAGSVPDLESCGFLAGSLPGLLVTYPVAIGLVAWRAARFIARKGAISTSGTVRTITIAGWTGGLIYFGAGLALLAQRSPITDIPLLVWPVIAALIALCGLGARIGAATALSARRVSA